MPHQKRVHISENSFAFFSIFTHTCYVIKNPFDFQTTEIGCQWQACSVLKKLRTVTFGKSVHGFSDTSILPNDGIVVGFSCEFIPNYGCFSLVRYTTSSNIFEFYIFVDTSQSNYFERIFPYFF